MFFGRELAESLLWVEGRLDEMHLWGYAAHPSQSRWTAKGQYLFLGGRYVRDRSLSHALNEAYRGLLMVGRMPVAFLHLDLPPEEVDINVHPTKVEVRFRDSNRVYSHLLATLRQTFLKSDLHSRLHANPEPGATTATQPAGSRSSMTTEPGIEPEKGVGVGSSLGRLDLVGGPSDRQTVASWFEPSKPRPQVPESVGQPVPREWAESLPVEFAVGPGESFDEFSANSSGSPPSPVVPAGMTAGSLATATTEVGGDAAGPEGLAEVDAGFRPPMDRANRPRRTSGSPHSRRLGP